MTRIILTLHAALILLALAFAGAVNAAAPQARCKLAILFASDVSDSVQAHQRVVVRKGTADALRQPEMAIGLDGGVFIAAWDWAADVGIVVDWIEVRSRSDLLAVADRIEQGRDHFLGDLTVFPNMLRLARAAFDALPCERHILDVMTDGIYSQPLAQERDRLFVLGQHQINVIFVGKPEWVDRMREGVQFGWGSFTIPVASYAEFPAAMRRKISMEVSMALTDRRPG